MLFTRKFILALAVALLASCGGGGDEPATLSPQAMASAQHAKLSAGLSAIDAAELLFNAAEGAFQQYFPGHQTTQSYGPFRFRQYGSYILGVVVTAGAGYDLYGVYVVGPGFGTLQAPALQGTMASLANIQVGDGALTYKTLSVTVTVFGQGTTVQLGSVPVPATQVDFCGGLSTDTTINQVLLAYGASFTLNSGGCSFTGTSGSFSGTVTVAPYGSVPFSVTYTYL